jgi:DNA-binding NtrC family response regulator
MFWKQKVVKKRTVLFVDDDEAILNSLKRGLLDETYKRLYAKSCSEALDMVERQDVHVIVTDMRMPEMSGLELIGAVKKEHPYIVAVVLSGYDHDAELKAAVDRGDIFALISKPWKLGGNFERIVRRAVDRYNLQKIGGRSANAKMKLFKGG